ncbi:hypothetical protein E3G66_003689 [Mycobacteroides abscessus]|nr:hypothetical protein E3G66_003689 [Mycobacteroides abscessus]SLG55529.1 Uncharacterised protein [Mycobacteroides abscessus subsp. abscessus]
MDAVGGSYGGRTGERSSTGAMRCEMLGATEPMSGADGGAISAGARATEPMLGAAEIAGVVG